MKFTTYWNQKIKNLDWIDIALIKIAIAVFALMLAQFIPSLLSVNWKIYLVIFILAAIRPMYKVYFK